MGEMSWNIEHRNDAHTEIPFDDEVDDFANLKMCTTIMILAPWNIPLKIFHLWIKTWHGIWIGISFQIMLYLLSSSNISFDFIRDMSSKKEVTRLKSRKTFKYRTAIYRIEKKKRKMLTVRFFKIPFFA